MDKIFGLSRSFFWKNSVDFWHQKLTLKVRFWHFLMNHNSLTDSLKKISFEYVDSWPKILLFRTHHLWNSTTEPITIWNTILIGFRRHKFACFFHLTSLYLGNEVLTFDFGKNIWTQLPKSPNIYYGCTCSSLTGKSNKQ